MRSTNNFEDDIASAESGGQMTGKQAIDVLMELRIYSRSEKEREAAKIAIDAIKKRSFDTIHDVSSIEDIHNAIHPNTICFHGKGKSSVPVQTKTDKCADWMEKQVEKCVDTYRIKNVAYGDSFGTSFKKYGAISSLVRIGDKFNRFESLVLGAENKVKDESIKDTLLDMANYCLMAAYEIEQEDKPIE